MSPQEEKVVEAAPSGVTQPEKPLLVELRWPLTLIVLALFALLIYFGTLWRAERAAGGVSRAMGSAADRVETMARGFLTGDVTEQFIASIPRVEGAGSGRLELATAEAVETFTRSDERRVLWDQFSLGTTTSEIKVPVTYRYHLRLDDPWKVEVAGETCVVYAPPIRPTQPPAIHTDRLQRRSQESWLRFDAAEQLTELERSITPRLVERASSERHIALVRDEARRTVAEFVRAWLLQEEKWQDDGLHSILVVFPGEDLRRGETSSIRGLDDGE